MEEPESNINEFFLYHVVLPRHLPAVKPKYSQQMALVAEMMKTITSLKQFIPSKTIKLFETFDNIHSKGTSADVSDIRDAIRSLKAGDTFAMFVRRQNCALMIHKRFENNECNNVVVATFPGDLPSNEIYKHASDIEVILREITQVFVFTNPRIISYYFESICLSFTYSSIIHLKRSM